MIKDKHIAKDACIDITKIQGGGNMVTGETYYVAKDGSQARTWLLGRVSSKFLKTTLDAAVKDCVASRGDRIFICPFHTETLSITAAVALNKIGVEVRGLGEGAARPIFTFSAVNATIAISAASVSLKNIILKPSIDSVVSPIVVSGADCTLDIEVQDASATVEFVSAALTTAAANRLNLKIKHVGFINGDACINSVRLVGVDTAKVEVDFYGKASVAIVEFHTTSCRNIDVIGRFYNFGTSLTKDVVDTITGSTWSAKGWDGDSQSSFSGGSGVALAADDVSSLSAAVAVIDGYHDVPTADATTDTVMRDVVGRKTDAGVQTVTVNKSLMAYQKAALDILAGVAGVTTFPAAVAAGNAVSLAEVIRYIQDNVNMLAMDSNATRYLAVTADMTSATWKTMAAHEIATVTGAVRLIILPEITGTLVGADATLVLGDETITNSIIASTAAPDLTLGGWWVDAIAAHTIITKTLINAVDIVVGNSKDIGYTVGEAALTGGSIKFHMWWSPISADGNVAAGAGGAL